MNVQATKRRMVMVMEVEEGVNSELYYTITQGFRAMNINEALRKANNKLCYALRTELPGLIVRNKSVTDEAMIDSDDTLIRFMVHDSIRKYAFPKVSDNNSHVIEISVGLEKGSDKYEGIFEFQVVIDSKEALYSVVEDVMLDIQMFYYYGLHNDYISLNERKEFSLLKVNFCKDMLNNNLSTMRYCSFATLCKNEKFELDCKRYIAMWREFVASLRDDEHITTNETEKKTDVIEYIMKNHPYSGQISRRRLTNMISELEKGRYVLVFLFSSPHKKKVIHNLQPMFKGSRLRRGAIMIIPYNMRTKYSKYSRYVCNFEFTI